MHSPAWVVPLSLLLTSVGAFYAYEPPGPVIETVHKATVGDYISKGFSVGLDGTSDSGLELQKASIKPRNLPLALPLTKRGYRHSKHHLWRKRTNGFKILASPPPTQAQSVAIHQDGTDFSYFSEWEIGSKKANLYMMVDTGSSDTWVMGSDCKTIACNTHSAFGSSNSDTLQITKTPFHIEYGTGNATGVIVRDTVKLAGLEVSLSFGSASTTSDQFNNYPVDGILGLGRPKGKVMDVQTFLEAVAEKKLLSANLFGVNLDRQVDGNPSGELNFGAPDPTKYAGDLSYTKLVADETNWEIPMDDVIVNGSPCKLTGISAVIDTGTTYMLIPPNDAKILHDKIPGSAVKDPETFMVPCDSKTPLQLVFSKIDYTISPEDYVGKPVAGNGSLCSSNIIGFQAYGEKQWLLGDVFLKNVYSVFDSDDGRIGFGKKGGASASTGPAAVASSSTTSSAKSPSSLPASSTASSASSAVLPAVAQPTSIPSVILPPHGTSATAVAASPSTTTTKVSAQADTTASISSSTTATTSVPAMPAGYMGAASTSTGLSSSRRLLFLLALQSCMICLFLF